MKKLFAVVLVMVLLASMAACATTAPSPKPAGKKLISIGIVNLHPSESGYREANVLDMDRVFNEANGYAVKKANYNTLNEQLDAAQQYINEDVEYLLISAADANGWDAVLKSAKEAGTKVFLFDRTINCDASLFEAAVVSDMAKEGDTAVEWLLNQDLESINVLHIQGQIGSAAQIGRSAALEREQEAGNLKIVRQGTGGDTWSADEAMRITQAAISAGESFNVIYAENDGMAEGAMKALDEAGITHGVDGDVIIMGFDFNRFALRYVMDGAWNYDGQCSPFQADVIAEFIQTLEKGEKLDIPENKMVINDEIFFEAGAITQADIDKYGIGE